MNRAVNDLLLTDLNRIRAWCDEQQTFIESGQVHELDGIDADVAYYRHIRKVQEATRR